MRNGAEPAQLISLARTLATRIINRHLFIAVHTCRHSLPKSNDKEHSANREEKHKRGRRRARMPEDLRNQWNLFSFQYR
jgi:hypothetical protein